MEAKTVKKSNIRTSSQRTSKPIRQESFENEAPRKKQIKQRPPPEPRSVSEEPRPPRKSHRDTVSQQDVRSSRRPQRKELKEDFWGRETEHVLTTGMPETTINQNEPTMPEQNPQQIQQPTGIFGGGNMKKMLIIGMIGLAGIALAVTIAMIAITWMKKNGKLGGKKKGPEPGGPSEPKTNSPYDPSINPYRPVTRPPQPVPESNYNPYHKPTCKAKHTKPSRTKTTKKPTKKPAPPVEEEEEESRVEEMPEEDENEGTADENEESEEEPLHALED